MTEESPPVDPPVKIVQKPEKKSRKQAIGASATKPPNWIARAEQAHRNAFVDAATRLRKHLFSSVLTVFVIGITLALPAGLEVLIHGVTSIGFAWEGSAQASLFLKNSVSTDQGLALSHQIENEPGISKTLYISRDQALAEFRQHSGYGPALDLLKDNPLPAVIVVTPDRHRPREETTTAMAALSRLPEVDQARYDEKWLNRLFAIFAFARRFVLVIASLFALTVIAVIANTVRLDVEARREEIRVMKLVGATDRFIRRPFLYSGMLYGVFGALTACALVSAGLKALVTPALALFEVDKAPEGLLDLSLQTAGMIFVAAMIIGLGASWLTVTQRLHEIEPS